MHKMLATLLGWLGLLSLSSSSNVPTDPGHLFIPVGSMFPSYSSWAITITLNVAPYQNRLEDLSVAQQNVKTLISKVESQNLSLDLKASVLQLKLAQTQLQDVANGLQRSFGDILYPSKTRDDVVTATALSKRAKRGLINGMGNLFSYLFGTATESEIQHLANNVKLLNQKDLVLAHQFNGTLTVLNATRIGMMQNRQALRSLQNAANSLTNAYDDVLAAVYNMSQRSYLQARIVTLTEATMRVTLKIQFLFSELNTLSQKLAFAQTGLLHKHLIPRRTFRKLLRKIAKGLPRTLALPFPSDNVNDYIRVVHTKVIEAKSRYHILFYIPLVHNKLRFNVYRFFPYHVPLHDHNVSLSYFPDEPRYLMMSDGQQFYIQPTESEVETCLLARQPFCPLHEPAYSASGSTSCIVALYRRDATASHKYCSPRLLPATNAPKAYYLTHGRWLLVSRPPFTLTISCLSTETSHAVTITRPVDIITLQPECSASGDTFYLPPYYASETHLALPSDLTESYYTNASLPIWRDTWSAKLRNVSKTLNPLHRLPELHVDGVPADTYFNQIMAQPLETVSSASEVSSTSMTLIIIIIILSVICLIYWIRHCCNGHSRGRFTFRSVPTEPSEPEPPIELPAVVPMVSPAQHPLPEPAGNPCALHSSPFPADQDVTPSRGATPLTPAQIAPELASSRPTPRLTPLA